MRAAAAHPGADDVRHAAATRRMRRVPRRSASTRVRPRQAAQSRSASRRPARTRRRPRASARAAGRAIGHRPPARPRRPHGPEQHREQMIDVHASGQRTPGEQQYAAREHGPQVPTATAASTFAERSCCARRRSIQMQPRRAQRARGPIRKCTTRSTPPIAPTQPYCAKCSGCTAMKVRSQKPRPRDVASASPARPPRETGDARTPPYSAGRQSCRRSRRARSHRPSHAARPLRAENPACAPRRAAAAHRDRARVATRRRLLQAAARRAIRRTRAAAAPDTRRPRATPCRARRPRHRAGECEQHEPRRHRPIHACRSNSAARNPCRAGCARHRASAGDARSSPRR